MAFLSLKPNITRNVSTNKWSFVYQINAAMIKWTRQSLSSDQQSVTRFSNTNWIFLCKSIPRDSEIGDLRFEFFFFSVYTIEKRNIITSTIEKEERFRTVPGGVLFSPPLRRIYRKMYFQKALREWFWIEPRLKRFSGFYYGRSL